MKFLISIFIFLIVLIFPKQTFAEEIFTQEKLITISLSSQTLTAWENGEIVHQSKVSTGLKYTPTVKGSFKIRSKIPIQDMKGNYPPYPPYHLKNVPHVMYFYGAYAIHGTYWHNNFGRVNSHGCVNLPLKSAEWVYNWAQVGTRVETY